MKKLFSLILAATMLVSFAACGVPAPVSQPSESAPAANSATDSAKESQSQTSAQDSELSANTVQFTDTQWNSTEMYVHYWSTSNDKMVTWPGSLMKPVPGEPGKYTYELPAGVEYIIFNDGSGKQTRDIKYDGTIQKFRNTSETDVDKSYYVETEDGQKVDTNEIGGSSEQVVDVEKLKEIEGKDTFGVRVTNKEFIKDYYDTPGKYGKDALVFDVQNTSGQTVSDITFLVVAYDKNNNILPIKTDNFRPYNIGYLIYTFATADDVTIDNNKTESLAMGASAGDIAGMRCIVMGYKAGGKTVVNKSAAEWLSNAIKGHVIELD